MLRGDSTEEPLRQLIDSVKKQQPPETVPNLVWRDSDGQVWENQFSYVPDDIGNVMVDHYLSIIRSVIRHRDLMSIIPVKGWIRYPITAAFTCRGCNHNCVICGGSKSAFKNFLNREKTAFRSPQDIARDVRSIGHFSNSPIFILGDIRQPGDACADELLNVLAQDRGKNQLMLEIFSPTSAEFLRKLSLACPDFCLEISPESHDPVVRKAAGKNYSNEEMEQTIADALAIGCGRLDVFFMIGLPKQTEKSVMETIDYCEYLLDRFKGDNRLSLFIGPLAPFLDPGSLAFEQPEKYGYRVLFRTLEEHRQALLAPSWRYTLNYETEWMTRHQIMDVTYEAILRLTRIKEKYGLISKKMAETQEWRIKKALELERRIGDIWCEGNYYQDLECLKPEVDRVNALRASERAELELPMGLRKLKLLPSLWSLLTKRG